MIGKSDMSSDPGQGMNYWRSLQELAGVRNEHVEAALREVLPRFMEQAAADLRVLHEVLS